MKIVMLSLSIGILGYFALASLPEPSGPPRLAASSQVASEIAPAEDNARDTLVVRGRH
jgi:hypothetical protein